jgi:hypothetical protein
MNSILGSAAPRVMKLRRLSTLCVLLGTLVVSSVSVSADEGRTTSLWSAIGSTTLSGYVPPNTPPIQRRLALWTCGEVARSCVTGPARLDLCIVTHHARCFHKIVACSHYLWVAVRTS